MGFIADRDQLFVLGFNLLHFIINAPHHESWGHVATACPYVLHVILLHTSNHITRHAFDSLPCSTDSSILSRLPRPSELFLFQVPTLLTQSGHMHKPSEIAGHWNSIKEHPRQRMEHRVTRHTSSYIRLPHYPSFLFIVIQNKISKSTFLHRTVTVYNNGGWKEITYVYGRWTPGKSLTLKEMISAVVMSRTRGGRAFLLYNCSGFQRVLDGFQYADSLPTALVRNKGCPFAKRNYLSPGASRSDQCQCA